MSCCSKKMFWPDFLFNRCICFTLSSKKIISIWCTSVLPFFIFLEKLFNLESWKLFFQKLQTSELILEWSGKLIWNFFFLWHVSTELTLMISGIDVLLLLASYYYSCYCFFFIICIKNNQIVKKLLIHLSLTSWLWIFRQHAASI